MARKQPSLGELELEVLKVLWEQGQSSVLQVGEKLAKPKGYARTTVLTVMQRLHKKGFLKRSKIEGVYRYKPTRSRKRVMGALLQDFLHQVFDGSSTSLVQHLTDTKVSTEELAEIRQIIDDADRESR